MKSFTLAEVLEALEKNGYEWAKGTYWDAKDNSSCATGQIARNLGYDPVENYLEFQEIAELIHSQLHRIVGDMCIVQQNDYANSYQDVVDWAKEKFAGYENKIITVTE
jgi:hypothetical protein